MDRNTMNRYILLDILVCSIVVYFYESCSGEPEGRVKMQMITKSI